MSEPPAENSRPEWSYRVLLSSGLAFAAWMTAFLGFRGDGGDLSTRSLLTMFAFTILGFLGFFSGMAALFSHSSRTGRNLYVLIPALLLSGIIVVFILFVWFMSSRAS